MEGTRLCAERRAAADLGHVVGGKPLQQALEPHELVAHSLEVQLNQLVAVLLGMLS